MARPVSAGTIGLAAAIVMTPLVAAQWLLPPMPLLARQLVLCGWGVGATLSCERMLFSGSWLAAFRSIGFAPAHSTTIAISLCAAIPMWILLPLLCRIYAIPFTLRSDWPLVLVGVILVNGVTEEVLHRGFVFHHLRQRHSFARAAAIGAAVFAAQHIYLVATIGWTAGVSSIILAALLTWPLAFVFERGGNSIAGPAILHTSSNAPMLIVDAADGQLTSILVLYMAGVLGSIYLVFAFRRA